MKKIFGGMCPTARMSDGNLLLSLPDALTPVVWVIDMAVEKTFIIKVEETDTGLYVLKKISATSQTDDIAYYKSKKKAIKGMHVITQAMDTNINPPSRNSLMSFLRLLFITILLIMGIIFTVRTILPILLFSEQNSTAQIDSPEQEPQTLDNIINQNNPESVGVPLSADNFLQNRTNNTLPF